MATFLAMRPDWRGRIVVVERDLTYRTSSTTLSAASIRLQFSTPLNIEISRFGIELIKDLDRWLGVDGALPPEIDFVEGGYLFLATEAGPAGAAPQPRRAARAQRAGRPARPAELRTRSWMRTDDLAGGSLGLADEGWFDAYALLQVFRRKARSLGVEYVAGESRRSSRMARPSPASAWPMAGRSPASWWSMPPARARPAWPPWSGPSCR